MEIMQSVSNFGVVAVTEIYNDKYNTGYIPKDLKTSISITLSKKPEAVDYEYCRTISLMSQITKILFMILQERIQNKIK